MFTHGCIPTKIGLLTWGTAPVVPAKSVLQLARAGQTRGFSRRISLLAGLAASRALTCRQLSFSLLSARFYVHQIGSITYRLLNAARF